MENLGRGGIALHHEKNNVFVSWRVLANDPDGIAFNVYRETNNGERVRLNAQPLKNETHFTDSLADLSQVNKWFINSVVGGKESKLNSPVVVEANAPVQPYLTIPLKTPHGYTPNDASVGDLDGDGEYELIIHMTGKAHDNSHKGFTDPPIFHAYKLDGTLLWSINLGKNIREGAHYTQFIVYDLDSDGRAEIACKTADGTTDGLGNIIGDPKADHRNPDGYILKGPEFLTVFDGLTGKELATTDYIPARHPNTETPTTEQLKTIWGDGYGNRMDRFLAGVAYLDGRYPSLVMTRGYYTRSVLAAWNWREGKLSHVWTFDSDASEKNKAYRGQGNHNLSVGDVDNDGKDEIIFGACVIDDNGEGLYSTGLGHGDALHLSDLDPDKPGLEIFDIQERFDDAGAHFRNARTGELYWKKPSVKAGEDGEGPGRGNSFDIDPRHKGAESWVQGANITGLFNAKGEKITSATPVSCNFAVWWDGDLLRELLDKNQIYKWNWKTETQQPLLTADGCTWNNGTKGTPVLSADLFGDWREEVIWRTADNLELRIYSSTIPTPYRFTTLMHDPVYRLGIAWQNVAYNQPPHVGFYLGEGMNKPVLPHVMIVKHD
ncbi:MAG TPA: rhamnogalacturonan lyase [Ohtaekwangia sp.]|nr:rhamnogalacturonan lyase [Ohtaekwangia sp.]